MKTETNNISTIKNVIADLEKAVQQAEERITMIKKMGDRLETLLREEQWAAVSIEHSLMVIRSMHDELKKRDEQTASECECTIVLGDNDPLPFDPMFERHELYDIENERHITVPGVIRRDGITTVYVHAVNGGIPVHDVIEIERVDKYGTAHTFRGHGVQARDGKWYESFEWGEWETVVTEMKAGGER